MREIRDKKENAGARQDGSCVSSRKHGVEGWPPIAAGAAAIEGVFEREAL